MSLKLRLFLLVGGLVALLLGAEAWLVNRLARDLSREVDHLALDVSESLLTTFRVGVSAPGDPASSTGPGVPAAVAVAPVPPAPGAPVVVPLDKTVRHLVVRTERRLTVDGATAAPDGAPAAPAPVGDDVAFSHVFTGDAAAVHAFAVELAPEATRGGGVLRLLGPGLDERIPIPAHGLDHSLDAFVQRLLMGSALILLVGLAASAAIVHRVTSPLSELAAAARAIGRGELGVQVPARGGREVEQAVGAFNGMSSRLAALDAESRVLRAREHLSELGEVARGLAHGLRNPLNALGLAVEELARAEGGSAGASRTALVEQARRQIRRMDAAVRSFLALATDGGSTVAADVDLAALAEDVALEALQDARGRVAARVEADPATPPVRGVAAELRSVLQALVVNAMEASPDGARVVVRVAPASPDGGADPPGAVIVDVLDEGPGVPASVRERLFTPHVTTKATGAGMGLFLAHRLAVVRHGGTLELEPREGGGTRARLRLPLRREVSRG